MHARTRTHKERKVEEGAVFQKGVVANRTIVFLDRVKETLQNSRCEKGGFLNAALLTPYYLGVEWKEMLSCGEVIHIYENKTLHLQCRRRYRMDWRSFNL
uniref:Uncharacterized protein n=1 Tax=Micrurus paraensis TaxID=1970185 RepID=A0A2D4L1C9_9SAUR